MLSNWDAGYDCEERVEERERATTKRTEILRICFICHIIDIQYHTFLAFCNDLSFSRTTYLINNIFSSDATIWYYHDQQSTERICVCRSGICQLSQYSFDPRALFVVILFQRMCVCSICIICTSALRTLLAYSEIKVRAKVLTYLLRK